MLEQPSSEDDGILIGGFHVLRPMPLRVVTERYLQWCHDLAGGNTAQAAGIAEVDVKTMSKYARKKKVL
jgi:hypothetical protein